MVIKIIVFQGSTEGGKQWMHFKVQATRFEGIATFQYITVQDLRLGNFSLAQFVAFMASGDLYIFLSHPMQGLALEAALIFFLTKSKFL